MRSSYFNAVYSLVGGKLTGPTEGPVSEIDFKDNQTPPTEEAIQAELDRFQAEFTANQYQRDRQPNYPNLAEQFDLLWHAIDADTLDKTSDFYTTLKAVKDAHPKG